MIAELCTINSIYKQVWHNLTIHKKILRHSPKGGSDDTRSYFVFDTRLASLIKKGNSRSVSIMLQIWRVVFILTGPHELCFPMKKMEVLTLVLAVSWLIYIALGRQMNTYQYLKEYLNMLTQNFIVTVGTIRT